MEELPDFEEHGADRGRLAGSRRSKNDQSSLSRRHITVLGTEAEPRDKLELRGLDYLKLQQSKFVDARAAGENSVG